MKFAIIMPSYGTRPFSFENACLFNLYCKKYGIDFFFEDQLPPEDEFSFNIPEKPERKCYAMKAYLPFKYLSLGYDKVAVVDDSAAVRPRCPNIFEVFDHVTCASVKSSKKDQLVSEKNISNAGKKLSSYGYSHYMNSGVVIYDKSMKDFLRPEIIIENSDLFENSYPHQTFLYYILNKNKIRSTQISSRFNMKPGDSVKSEERRGLVSVDKDTLFKEKCFISHVTSGFHQREKLADSIIEYFWKEWLGK